MAAVCVNIALAKSILPYGVREHLEVLSQHNHNGSPALIVACMLLGGHKKQLGGHPPIETGFKKLWGSRHRWGSITRVKLCFQPCFEAGNFF